MNTKRKNSIISIIAIVLFFGTIYPIQAKPLSGTLHSANYFNLLTNGDFENGTTGWTTVQGYFAVSEYPDSSNHVALLRGASGYTSEISQTITGLTPGQYALYFETEGHTSCNTTATVVSGAFPFSTTVNSNAGAFTLDFTVPSGSSSATVTLSVTGSGLGRYIRLDNGFVIEV
jgi:hypothetical protein